MRAYVVLIMTLAASCERAGEIDEIGVCPPEATVEVVQYESDDDLVLKATCRWGNRRIVVDTNAREEVVDPSGLLDAEMDGFSIRSYPERLRTELTFRRGRLHGLSRLYLGEEVVQECTYVDGVRDGVCWAVPTARLPFSKIEQYDRGKRTGFWSSGLEGTASSTTRVYGDDVLLAIDGQPVPLPPEWIEVDGGVMWRKSCPPRRRNQEACPSAFDAYQTCALDGGHDHGDCLQRARATYWSFRDRERAKEQGRSN